jgi:hypothetical protein
MNGYIKHIENIYENVVNIINSSYCVCGGFEKPDEIIEYIKNIHDVAMSLSLDFNYQQTVIEKYENNLKTLCDENYDLNVKFNDVILKYNDKENLINQE